MQENKIMGEFNISVSADFIDSHRRSVNSASGFYFRLFVNFLNKYTYPFQRRPIGITLFWVHECPFRYSLFSQIKT